MRGKIFGADQGLGYLNSPDWSYGLITQESQGAHDLSKFAGAFGVETLTGAWAGRVAAAVDETGRCANWFSRLWNGGCFVPGTLVTLSEMPQGHDLQSALWANDSFLGDISENSGVTALLETPTRAATTFKIPIEDVPLGARVPTKNPRPWEFDDSLPEPDEATWAKISITTERLDGQIIDAELIRPIAWINAHQLREGASLPMHFEELQLDGAVHVTAVEACPPIATGDGSVVTARFVTREVDEIATITIVGPDGKVESLSGTTIHPVWSIDRLDWVQLGELSIGESLQAADGIAVVSSVTLGRCTTQVYNIEVHGEHVYTVGKLGVLVHNVYQHVDGGIATADQALDGAISYLGAGYRDMGRGRFLSADGLRQVRLGAHELNPTNMHIHFEHYDTAWDLGGTIIESTFTLIR